MSYPKGYFVSKIFPGQVWKFLSEKEEAELIDQAYRQGSQVARKRLILAFQPLVEKYALINLKKILSSRTRHSMAEDLFNEGFVGLLEAAKRYDPERGFKLATFATSYIHSYIIEYVIKAGLLKLPTSPDLKKIFTHLPHLKNKIGVPLHRALPDEQRTAIAEKLGVAVEKVIFVENYFSSYAGDLDAPLKGDTTTTMGEGLISDEESFEERLAIDDQANQRLEFVYAAMQMLDPRRRHIFRERYLKDRPTTYEILSKPYNVSRERIRQLDMQAYAKVQEIVRALESGDLTIDQVLAEAKCSVTKNKGGRKKSGVRSERPAVQSSLPAAIPA